MKGEEHLFWILQKVMEIRILYVLSGDLYVTYMRYDGRGGLTSTNHTAKHHNLLCTAWSVFTQL